MCVDAIYLGMFYDKFLIHVLATMALRGNLLRHCGIIVYY